MCWCLSIIAKCSLCGKMFQLPAVRAPIPPQPKVSRIINSVTLSHNLYQIIFFHGVCFSSLPPALPHITHVPIKAGGSVPLQAPSHSYPDTTTGSTRMAHSYRLHTVCLDGMFNIGKQLAGQRPVFHSPSCSITIFVKYQHDT